LKEWIKECCNIHNVSILNRILFTKPCQREFKLFFNILKIHVCEVIAELTSTDGRNGRGIFASPSLAWYLMG
jgi:hypothetical protein